jgi:hypothetical protein
LGCSKSRTNFSSHVVSKLSLNFEILAIAWCVVQKPSTEQRESYKGVDKKVSSCLQLGRILFFLYHLEPRVSILVPVAMHAPHLYGAVVVDDSSI